MPLPLTLRQQLLRADGGTYAVESDRQAYRLCRSIAFWHYENFPVASLVLGNMRDDVAAIYAFARLADDVADEIPASPEQKCAILDELQKWISAPVTTHPIARAIHNTLTRRYLPYEPLDRLLEAFRYDANFRPFATETELLNYCYNSASSIGELMLRLAGQWNEQTASYSDAFCAGLQVLNFWQDIGMDIPRGYCTIPLEWLPGEYSSNRFPDLNLLPASIVLQFDRLTAQLLPRALLLLTSLEDSHFRIQVHATWESALRIWERCRKRHNRWWIRPSLKWYDIPIIAIYSLMGARL